MALPIPDWNGGILTAVPRPGERDENAARTIRLHPEAATYNSPRT